MSRQHPEPIDGETFWAYCVRTGARAGKGTEHIGMMTVWRGNGWGAMRAPTPEACFENKETER